MYINFTIPVYTYLQLMHSIHMHYAFCWAMLGSGPFICWALHVGPIQVSMFEKSLFLVMFNTKCHF